MNSLKPPVASANINRTARRKQVNYSALYENGKPPENSLHEGFGTTNSYQSSTKTSRPSITNINSSSYLFNNINNNSINSINNSSNSSKNNINNINSNINNSGSTIDINNINTLKSKTISSTVAYSNSNLTTNSNTPLLEKHSSLLNNNNKHNNQKSISKTSSYTGFNTFSNDSRNNNNNYKSYSSLNQNFYNSYKTNTFTTNNTSNQVSELQKINKDLMNELNEVKNELLKCQNENKKLKELNSKIEEKLLSMNSSDTIPKSFENISKTLEEVIRKKNLCEKQLKDNGIEPIIYSEKQTSNDESTNVTENETKENPSSEPETSPPKNELKNEKELTDTTDTMSSIDIQRKKFEDECLSFTQFMSEKDDIINKLMTEIENKTAVFTNLVNDAKKGDSNKSISLVPPAPPAPPVLVSSGTAVISEDILKNTIQKTKDQQQESIIPTTSILNSLNETTTTNKEDETISTINTENNQNIPEKETIDNPAELNSKKEEENFSKDESISNRKNSSLSLNDQKSKNNINDIIDESVHLVPKSLEQEQKQDVEREVILEQQQTTPEPEPEPEPVQTKEELQKSQCEEIPIVEHETLFAHVSDEVKPKVQEEEEEEEEKKEDHFNELSLSLNSFDTTKVETSQETSSVTSPTDIQNSNNSGGDGSYMLDLQLQGDDMKDMVMNLFENGFW